MIKVAILGYGNIGKYAEEAVMSAPDMALAGIYHHRDNLEAITADVVLLCTPTRAVEQFASFFAQRGICTVDSFDIHNQIYALRSHLMPVCIANKCVSVISAGWDPGSDSMIRALLLALAPKGITYTNFGPGRSMGHSVAVRAIEGVKDSLSMAANYNLANNLFRQNDMEQSAKVLDRIKEVAPTSEYAADYYYNAGDVAIAKKDWQAAVDALKQSLLRNPGDLDAKENYIYARKMLENQQQQQQNQNNHQTKGKLLFHNTSPFHLGSKRCIQDTLRQIRIIFHFVLCTILIHSLVNLRTYLVVIHKQPPFRPFYID